jgi:cytochrome c-type biogenesis protein CcmE
VALVAQSSPAAGRARLHGANLKFFIAGGVIALAVVYLVAIGLQGTTVYFLTVSELQAKGATAQSQPFRVSGNLVPGSLARDATGLGIHFSIADAAAATPLTVTYKGGQVPDIIGDNIEIVAEGRLDGQGTFMATNVLAKCPSRLADVEPTERDYSANK